VQAIIIKLPVKGWKYQFTMKTNSKRQKKAKVEINKTVFSFPNPANVSLFNQSLPRVFLREKENLDQGEDGRGGIGEGWDRGGPCETHKGGEKERKEEKWKGEKKGKWKKGLRE